MFDTLLENLCSDSCTQDEVVESTSLLHAFVVTSEVSVPLCNEVSE